MSQRIILIDHISTVTPNNIIKEAVGSGPHASLIIQGIIQRADTVNGNGRYYKRETLEREVEQYKMGPVKLGNALGELDHPESSVVSLQTASHRVIDIWWEGDNVMGKIEVLDTPMGRIVMELAAKKIPIGISSRGMGSVKQIGERVEVGNDFELLCFDLVSTPSTPNAYLYPLSNNTASLSESLNSPVNTSKYKKVNDLIFEMLTSR